MVPRVHVLLPSPSSSALSSPRGGARQRRHLPLVQSRGLLPERRRLRGVPRDRREPRAADRLGVARRHAIVGRGPELTRAVREEADAARAGGTLGAGAGAVAGGVEVALVDWSVFFYSVGS